MNDVEFNAISNPLTTGLAVSAGQALQIDILPECAESPAD